MALIEYRAENGIGIIELNNPPANAYTLDSLKLLDSAIVAARFFEDVELPGAVPVIAATAVLIGAAILASLMPAARASRIDVIQALRSE